MKIIFFGSDHFSLSSLQACIESGNEITLIVTTPAQKKGRGLAMTSAPVQAEAEKRELPFIAPPDLKDPETYKCISALAPDFYVVSSYGKYIPSSYLGLPKLASLNVHPSLLPLYRGSSPIQAALLSGDASTGVSIIEVAKKLDAGDIFRQVSLAIDTNDDYPSLSRKLAELSHSVLLEILTGMALSGLTRRPQMENLATYTRKFEKDDGLLKWENSVQDFDRKARALRPWPGTYVLFENTRLALLELEPAESASHEIPGRVLEIGGDGSMLVSVGSGAIRISRVQLAGKNAVTARDFANGRRIKPGFTFVSP